MSSAWGLLGFQLSLVAISFLLYSVLLRIAKALEKLAERRNHERTS